MAAGGTKSAGKTKRIIPWEKVRAAWEADAGLTHAEIARQFGLTKQAVQKRAKREGWAKLEVGAPEVQQAIADRADELQRVDPAKTEVLPPEAQQPTVPAGQTSALGKAAGIEARAKIIDRQRREITLVRNHFYKAMNETDSDKQTVKLKQTKLGSEIVEKMHNAERKAWGLDAGAPTLVVQVIPPSERDDHD